MPTPRISSLEAQIAALEAENEELRSRVATSSPVIVEPVATSRRRGAGWTVLSAALITIGALLAPIGVVSAWASNEITNTDAFVATFAPLADDPDVQAFVAAEAATAIDEKLDIDALTSNVIDGVIELGTGPLATQALNALKAPAAAGIKGLVTNVIDKFVASDAFAAIWEQTLRTSHTQALLTLEGSSDAAIVAGTNGDISISLAPIIAQLKTVLVDQGVTIAAQIPAINKTIVIANSSALGTAQAIYPIATGFAPWLIWIALAFLVVGVLVARRRSVALIVAAIALAITMLATTSGFFIGQAYLANALGTAIPQDTSNAVFELLVASMRSTIGAITILAVTVAIVGYLAGPFRFPRLLRGFVVSGFAKLRENAEARGITTGRTGVFVYRYRHLLRAAVAVGASAIVLLVRPLSGSSIGWTLFVAVILLLVIELVQRPTADVELVIEEVVVDEAAVGPIESVDA